MNSLNVETLNLTVGFQDNSHKEIEINRTTDKLVNHGVSYLFFLHLFVFLSLNDINIE